MGLKTGQDSSRLKILSSDSFVPFLNVHVDLSQCTRPRIIFTEFHGKRGKNLRSACYNNNNNKRKAVVFIQPSENTLRNKKYLLFRFFLLLYSHKFPFQTLIFDFEEILGLLWALHFPPLQNYIPVPTSRSEKGFTALFQPVKINSKGLCRVRSIIKIETSNFCNV